jgi:hypothetical protein
MFFMCTTVASTSNGLTEAEFILRSYSSCKYISIIIICNSSKPNALWEFGSYLAGQKFPTV